MGIRQALTDLTSAPDDRDARRRFLESCFATVQESLLVRFGRFGTAYEDLLHSALCQFFSKALDGARNGRLDPDQYLEGYLRTMAANAFRDELRSRIRDPLHAAVSLQHEGQAEPEVADPNRDVLELLEQLEEPEQALIWMRLAGHDFPAIGDALTISTEAARQRYTRLIKKLRGRFFSADRGE